MTKKSGWVFLTKNLMNSHCETYSSRKQYIHNFKVIKSEKGIGELFCPCNKYSDIF